MGVSHGFKSFIINICEILVCFIVLLLQEQRLTRGKLFIKLSYAYVMVLLLNWVKNIYHYGLTIGLIQV
jgi:hypothetical protein